MRMARNDRLVAIVLTIAFAASPVLAQRQGRSSSVAKQPTRVTAKIEDVDGKTGRLVILGTNRADHVTIKPYAGSTKGGVPSYEVLVKGSDQPILVFASRGTLTGLRVTTIFMDGKRGRDRLDLDDKAQTFSVQTNSVESGPYAKSGSGQRTRRGRGRG